MSTSAVAFAPRLGRSALLVACATLSTFAHALTPSEFFAKVAPSVWLVRVFDKDGMPTGTGSAVVIAPETLITNCHVLKGAHSFQLEHEGRVVVAKLDMWDTARDVCQVKAARLNAPAVELGDSDDVVVGEAVYTLGAPRGLELTLSNGLVSALRLDQSRQIDKIQISAPISHGSSGGGLFDTDGRLIGITSSGYDDSQNLNFARPVNFVRELPARHLAIQQNLPLPVRAPAPPRPPAPRPAPVPAPAPAPARQPPAPIIVTTVAPPAPAPLPVPTPMPPAAAPIAAPQPVAPRRNDTIAPNAPPGTARIPFLNDQRQQEYWQYLAAAPYPKACAISDNGHYACSGGDRPRDRSLPSDPKYRALKRCAELAGKPCSLYQIDDQVVYAPPVPTP